MAQRRVQEDQRAALSTMLTHTQLASEQAASQERVRRMRLARDAESERQTVAQLEAMENAHVAAAIAQQKREEEERLAAVIDSRKAAAEREARRVSKIAAESSELRALKQKLDAALVEAEQAQQRDLNEKRRQAERGSDDDVRANLKAAEAAYAAEKARIAAEQEAKKKAAAAALDNQIAQRDETIKAAAMAEFLRDKQLVDEVVSRIAQEDDAARQTEAQRKLATRDHMNYQMKERAEIRRREHEMRKAEDAAIAAYLAEKDRQEKERAAEAERVRQIKEAIQKQQSAHLAATRAQDEHLQALRTEVQMAEAEEAARLAEENRRRKMVELRQQMQEAYQHAQHVRAERARQEAEEEERFREQMLAKFAADEKLEQMAAAKRRLRQMEHKREVERLLEVRRAQLEAERAAEAEDAARARREEEERQEIVRRERLRMLKEYGAKLVGHLPPGVFLSTEELQVLPEDVREDVLRAIEAKRRREQDEKAYVLSTSLLAQQSQPGKGRLW
jgi:hypothetical protein